METRPGVCNLCEAICGLAVTVQGDTIRSVRGNTDDPLSRGHICPKAVALQDIHTDPDRPARVDVLSGNAVLSGVPVTVNGR